MFVLLFVIFVSPSILLIKLFIVSRKRYLILFIVMLSHSILSLISDI
jgi:hypothetical protein